MARTPQVTRTIQTTKVNVLCLNIKEGNPFNQTVVLPRTYKDDKHILKAVEKVINSDSVKAVHVVDTVVEETLYGMTEQKFIELATVLPPRKSTDKNGDNDTDNEDENDENGGTNTDATEGEPGTDTDANIRHNGNHRNNRKH